MEAFFIEKKKSKFYQQESNLSVIDLASAQLSHALPLSYKIPKWLYITH